MAQQAERFYESVDDGSLAEWVYDDLQLLAGGLHVVTGKAPLIVYYVLNGKTVTNTVAAGSDVVLPLASALALVTRPLNQLFGRTGFAIGGLSAYGCATVNPSAVAVNPVSAGAV